jgi:hypothetical protein
MLNIYGAVILNGVEFDDNQIHNLLWKDTRGWTFGGDQLEEDSNFCVASDDGVVNATFKSLEATKAFVNRLNEIPTSAHKDYAPRSARALLDAERHAS